jgi:hypothetical protein
MSKVFVHSFFPAHSSLLDTYLPAVSQLLLPDDVAELCPEPTLKVTVPLLFRSLLPVSTSSIIVVRNPVLAFAAIVGMAIGFGGARRYYHWHHYDSTTYTSILWSVAYLCFGLMNFVALPLHCLVESSTTEDNVALQHPWLWVLDCFLTGASSLAIILASLSVYQRHIFPTKWVSGSTSMVTIALLYVFMFEPNLYSWIRWNCNIGVASIACFLWCSYSTANSNDERQDESSPQRQQEIISMMKTLPLELWYSVPIAVAGQVLFPLLFLHTSSDGHKDRLGIFFCTLGATVVVLGLLLDATLCRWTQGALVWDGLMASSLTFWGCDIAFFGMGLWLDKIVFARNMTDRKTD